MPRRALFAFFTATVLSAGFAHSVQARVNLKEIEETRRLNLEQTALNKRALPPRPELAQLPPRAAPTMKVDTQPAGGTETVAALANPPKDIGIANVRDASGRIVGAVQRVDLGKDGKPVQVEVALLSDQDHLVSLNADTLGYDAAKNEITVPRRLSGETVASK